MMNMHCRTHRSDSKHLNYQHTSPSGLQELVKQSCAMFLLGYMERCSTHCPVAPGAAVPHLVTRLLCHLPTCTVHQGPRLS